MKGIILAGGSGSRLYPATRPVCKQLLPVFDKPMIYYPLATLMQSGIRDILIISTPEDTPKIREMFQQGSLLGINITYAVQNKPRGIADAFILGNRFIGNDSVCLILGDNIFYGNGVGETIRSATECNTGATIFGYAVKDPHRYGVISFDKSFNITSIEEKPKKPKSKYAVVGIYIYNNDVVSYAKKLLPSKRGELEITDLNNIYLKNKNLKVKIFGKGVAWLDTGTHASLLDASTYIKVIEERQGIKVACLEEIAYENGFIDKKALSSIIRTLESRGIKNEYVDYLRGVL